MGMRDGGCGAWSGRFASSQTKYCGADASDREHDSKRVSANHLTRHRAEITDFGEGGEDKSRANEPSQESNQDGDDSFHFSFRVFI